MNNQPLIIHGSDDFKKAVLKIAIHQDLPISFDDLIMQNDFLSYKDVDYPDRKKFALVTAQKILQANTYTRINVKTSKRGIG